MGELPQIWHVVDFAALRNLGNKDDNDIAYVTRRDNNDGECVGGGVFIMTWGIIGQDDNATCIQSGGSPPCGSWIRRLDGDLRRAEWFGAIGSGMHNDIVPINSCLQRYGRVDLMAKTYLVRPIEGVACFIGVGSGNRVCGDGIDKTKLLFALDESPFWWSAAFSCVISSWPSPSDGVVISDLTIGCGFNASNKKVTRMAIQLTGANNVVERVKAVDYGVGKPPVPASPQLQPVECFVISLKLSSNSPAQDADKIMGTIQDCLITDPGRNGDVGFTETPPEITCLLIQGESNSKLGLGGVIRRNKVYNCMYDNISLPQSSRQISPLHGITVAQCTAAEISENEVINFDGTGVLVMSWRDEDTIVRANRFLNVTRGIQWAVVKAETGTLPADDPYHLRVRVVDNTILLGKYIYVDGDWLQGIGATIGSGIVESPIKTRLEGLIIEHNLVRGVKGAATDYKECYGIRVQFDTDIFNNLIVQRNVLEVPAQSGYPPALYEDYENALVWVNKLSYRQDRIKVRDNRNLAGNGVRLKVLYFGSPATAEWGPFEMSVTRRHGVGTDARSTNLYEEFVGLAPGYTLGWQQICGATGLVNPQNGDEGLVGIVKLTCGAGSTGSAVLRLGGTSDSGFVLPFLIGSSVGRIHVFEFNLKRGMYYDANHKYQVRIGLMDSVAAATGSWSPVGVYLKCHSSYDQNTIRGYTVSSSSPLYYNYLNLWTEDPSNPPLRWHRVRMEVSAARVLFYVDGACIQDGITQQIPQTVPLLFAFCVHGETGSSEARHVLLDSFSYEII
jgi:hypothetical protein